MYKLLAKFFLNLHNFSARMSGKFGHKLEGGPHPKQRLMQYHQFFLDNIDADNSVLDIGCGRGELTHGAAIKAKSVVGIDIKEKNIKRAKENHSADNLEYIVGDATRVLFEAKPRTVLKFDVIILSNVLEHIENRVEFLQKIKRLAPEILIRVPMMNRDWITLYKKDLGVRWKLDVSHFTEYTEESFRKEIESAGLKVCRLSIQFGEIWAVVN